jgi:1-acyl-sn-glycerol-3-phosphate acyltransferase
LAHPADHPSLPPALRHPRGWALRALGQAYLGFAGWRIEGAFPTESKYVLIVAPHTSNWDFTLGVAVLFALELRVSWLGKHAIFRAPFKRLLRWMGGIPVNRSASHGVVGECVKAFRDTPALMLALAPEGTRKGVNQWKTGFYRIAVQAGVPIMPVGFDFRTHTVQLMPLFHPTGDLEADLPILQAQYQAVHGLRERPTAQA